MKLTKEIRKAVADRAASELYDKQIDAEFEKLKDVAYQYLIDTGEYRAIEDIPDGWQPYVKQSYQVFIKVGGKHGGGNSISLMLPKRLASQHSSTCIYLGSCDDPWPGQDAYQALSKKRRDLESEIYAVLMSCTTVKQAIETLHELANYMPDESAPVTALVPMQQVERLRAILAERTNE
jgi:hypothetical protein